MTGYQCPYCLSYAKKTQNYQLAIDRNKPGMCINCESPRAEHAPMRLQQYIKQPTTIKGVSIE